MPQRSLDGDEVTPLCQLIKNLECEMGFMCSCGSADHPDGATKHRDGVAVLRYPDLVQLSLRRRTLSMGLCQDQPRS